MKKKTAIKIILSIIAALTVIIIILFMTVACAARFVFLSPSCYSDNATLTEQENYFIKKTVLKAVEDRLSVFADGDSVIYDQSATDNNVIQLDKSQNNPKHIFILINSDFMRSVTKEEDGYTVCVQTYFMETSTEDCVYEIHISNDYLITSFGLDP